MLFLPVLRRFARTQTVRVLSAGAIVYDECHSIFNVVEGPTRFASRSGPLFARLPPWVDAVEKGLVIFGEQ
jgi:hypothetical protein